MSNQASSSNPSKVSEITHSPTPSTKKPFFIPLSSPMPIVESSKEEGSEIVKPNLERVIVVDISEAFVFPIKTELPPKFITSKIPKMGIYFDKHKELYSPSLFESNPIFAQLFKEDLPVKKLNPFSSILAIEDWVVESLT